LAGGINPFVYALNSPINCIDPLGLLVGYMGYGGANGHGDGFEGVHAGLYGESSLSNKREWGTYISGGEGDINGFAYSPVGFVAGLSWGTIEDMEKASKAIGINIFGFTIEMTYDPCNDSFLEGRGFNIGLFSRGVGFGTYELDTKSHHKTIDNNYEPFFSK